ncbi:hypothetical protein LZ318_07310 [Saccharopolyspora indica]|uniref:hypothetical protein n=1 Tax=Saccharopolyspora indica TaxID=1229659 RepID=UPI0022EBA307|nr:hypothetical protein [Saccharopolyspora indica]MDA3647957.1 hypothetical protein [Saccharopolyspora indica]
MSETPGSALMPEHAALLAVDMIGSGSSRPEHLSSIPELVRDLTRAALRAVGLGSDAVQDDQFTGDGFLRVYPSRFLPTLVDMIGALDEFLAAHNRFSKPEIRLRVAVHLGALPAERGFHRPNIDLSRLLDAAAFKQVVQHCQEHITTDAFTTALILSDIAYRTVFQEDYTRVIDRNEFAPLLITNKEFTEHSWVRVTGVHPSQISSIPLTGEPAAVSPEASSHPPGSASGERSISNSGSVHGNQVTGDGNTFRTSVSNSLSGANTAVHAGTFHGNVNHSEQGKYNIDAKHTEQVQIGDGNTQHVDRRQQSVHMEAEASGNGRVYQALGDQHITDR